MLTWGYQKPTRIVNGEPVEQYGVGDCLSTDTKPTTGIANGSVLHEMDTSTTYKYNAEGGEWVEVTGDSGTPSDIQYATRAEVRGVLND